MLMARWARRFGVRTMAMVIEKARKTGSAFGSVGESNHFGIAGYYAMMALEENMIGISMTNTSLLGCRLSAAGQCSGRIRWLLPPGK